MPDDRLGAVGDLVHDDGAAVVLEGRVDLMLAGLGLVLGDLEKMRVDPLAVREELRVCTGMSSDVRVPPDRCMTVAVVPDRLAARASRLRFAERSGAAVTD